MRALTLQRPWGYAIAHLGKRVENRTWTPPASMIGRRLAIHEGKIWDAAGADWIESTLGIVLPASLQHALGGDIVATAELRGVSKIADTLPGGQWAALGQVHWLLANVCVINPPVTVRGAQGLWSVPDEMARAVVSREQPVRDGSDG